MLDGLQQVRGDTVLPSVLQFYSDMPMLYALGQHAALLSLQDFLLPDEHLLYVVCLPDRIGPIFKHLQEALEQYARILIWGRRRSGVGEVMFLLLCVEMQAAIRVGHPNWPRGVCTGRTPGHHRETQHSPQFCGPGPSKCLVAPLLCHVYPQLLGISGVGETQDWASLPVFCGASLEFGSQPTGRWADSLRMINSRHPGVAATMVRCLVGPTDSRHFSAAAGLSSGVGFRRS